MKIKYEETKIKKETINTEMVIIGEIGSDKIMKYTTIGNSINIA